MKLFTAAATRRCFGEFDLASPSCYDPAVLVKHSKEYIMLNGVLLDIDNAIVDSVVETIDPTLEVIHYQDLDLPVQGTEETL